MATTLMDPTSELQPDNIPLAARPATLEDQVVALLDISKARGDVFLDHVEARLEDRGIEVRRYRKPTFTKPAPVDLRAEISQECTMVIEALAD